MNLTDLKNAMANTLGTHLYEVTVFDKTFNDFVGYVKVCANTRTSALSKLKKALPEGWVGGDINMIG